MTTVNDFDRPVPMASGRVADYLPRVHSSVGNPIPYKVVASQLVANPDGATIMPTGLPYGGSGIVVAVEDRGIVITSRVRQALADANLTVLDLVETWVQSRGNSQNRRQSLRPWAYGTWTDGTGDIFLDLVEIFPDDEVEEATRVGRERNQISIWHAGRGEEILTGGNGGSEPGPSAGQLADYEELPPLDYSCKICGDPRGH